MFKTKASKAESILKAAGYSVTVNAERPRKGTFAITLQKGDKVNVILEYLSMPRPFKKLREADIEADIKSGIKDFEAAN